MQQIIEIVDKKFDYLIDIGADHGYLGIEMLKLEKVSHVWNVDKNKKPLYSCEKNFDHHKLKEHASFFLSDGFTDVPTPQPNSLLVISGLGTKTMINILAKLPDSNISEIVLLPHNFPILIRKWAAFYKWEIIQEKYFEEKEIIYLCLRLKKKEKSSHNNNLYKPIVSSEDLFDEEYNEAELTTFLNNIVEEFTTDLNRSAMLNEMLKPKEIFFGKSEFINENYELWHKYWIMLVNRINKKTERFIQPWEKDFLKIWDVITSKKDS